MMLMSHECDVLCADRAQRGIFLRIKAPTQCIRGCSSCTTVMAKEMVRTPRDNIHVKPDVLHRVFAVLLNTRQALDQPRSQTRNVKSPELHGLGNPTNEGQSASCGSGMGSLVASVITKRKCRGFEKWKVSLFRQRHDGRAVVAFL